MVTRPESVLSPSKFLLGTAKGVKTRKWGAGPSPAGTAYRAQYRKLIKNEMFHFILHHPLCLI